MIRRSAWISFASFTVAVLLWDAAVRLSGHTLIPGPLAVARALGDLFVRGLLLKDAVASLFRVTWGYLAAVLVAVPFGLLLGWSRRGDRAFGPLLSLLRPISPLAWIPLAILWFGVGDLAAVFLIFIASALPLTVSAIAAARSVSATHVDAARNFGLNPAQIVWRVLYPAALPQLLVGLRLALGIAWLVVVAAEMIAVNSGLGFLIIDSRNAGDRYDQVVAGMVAIGVIGFLLDAGLRRLERLPQIRWGVPS